MAQNYPQFLSSMMAGAEAHAPISSDELSHPFLAAPHFPINAGPISYQNFGHYPGFPGPSFSFQPPMSKGRRKSSSAANSDAEQVKHRRTRSGCFTCRSRRVKCDETRPICERCRKGGRDCVYPDPSASKGSSRQKESTANTASNQSPSSSNSDDNEQDDSSKAASTLHTITDEDEGHAGQDTTSPKSRAKNRLVVKISDNAAFESYSVSPSPSTTVAGDRFPLGSPSSDFRAILQEDPNLSHLPGDYQTHLQYFYENITCHHYSLINDTDNFFVRGMIIEASRNKLLLNAVVAFSAYIRSFQHPEGSLRDFLLYYNRSITLLLECLNQEEAHNLSTLLSILQLATIEEYLGDWLNLMGHQKAALELFTKLFTPATVMETRIGQICLEWYSRFDADIAFLGTIRSKFSREWLTTAAAYYQEKSNQEPNEIFWKAEERQSRLRIIRHDMSALYFGASNSEFSTKEYIQEHDKITTQLMNWRDSWNPQLTSPNLAVSDFPWKRAAEPDDIVDPYEPGLLYNPPLFSSTIAAIEWHAMVILHKSQAKDVPREKLLPDILRHSYAVCQLFEAMEYWPSTPKGIIPGIGSILSLSALFLPRDARHRAWLWRKFALLETMGSIQSLSFRTKVAELFHDEDAAHWWLPSGQGFSPMLQSIRNFADERHNAAAHAQLDSVQAVGRLFDKLNLDGASKW